MAEGIQLYKHFLKELDKAGKIKRAWFTTFNLDVSFFEKYMLSALMGVSYKELRSPYDYEALNLNLANDQEFEDDNKIEVKVFYDYRALMVTGRQKQTSVQIYPVDIKQIRNLNSNLKFDEGVFHPKVMVLESYRGEYWIMASSANLTFGGWARNRESFFLEKIENTKIARDIGSFFSGIISSQRGFENNPLLDKLNSGRFGEKAAKWYFFSSIDENSFLDQLNNGAEKTNLRVWSPYYADDLPGVLDDLQEEYFQDIDIIPAKNEANKIRIVKETFEACASKKGITFKQDKPSIQSDCFVHAKVWVTPSSLAIGSWNMTKAGMNISRDKNNNLEAGVIYSHSSKEYNDLLAENSIGPLKDTSFFKAEELEKEKEEVFDNYTITVDLIIDWDKLMIYLQNPTYSKLVGHVGSGGYVKLPGLGKVGISEMANGISIRHSSRTYLTDRFFEVSMSNGTVAYRGFIREIGLACRPINKFDNLDDYLKGWVLEMPEDKDELHKLAYTVEQDNGDEISENTRSILMARDQNAWFTSFHAFECIINRINKTDNLYARDKVTELKKIGRILPGSLSELKEHLEKLMDLYRTDKMNFVKSPIYLWFLIEKANHVLSLYNSKITLQDERISTIKNLKLNEVIEEKEMEKFGIEKVEKWKNYISSKLKAI